MDAIELFMQLKRFYVETGDEKEWALVYSALFEMPEAPYTTFIKLGYFRRCIDAVQRFQDIPSEYKISRSPAKLFVSHKWEAKDHPDRSRRTLEKLLALTRNCDDDAGVWWDYCSLPQRSSTSGEDDRTVVMKEFFKFQLSLIPLVILDCQCMFLWSAEGLHSGWCCIELLVAEALLQHLNRMIYTRKNQFTKPPLFVTQVGNRTLVETDLFRFDHRIVHKMYCSETAFEQHRNLIGWMNVQVNGGEPTPYTQMIKQVSPQLISRMASEHELGFTNGADSEVVSKMLSTIYSRLSFEPFNTFKWTGQVDFFSQWHYVKGCLGNCVVPNVAYSF